MKGVCIYIICSRIIYKHALFCFHAFLCSCGLTLNMDLFSYYACIAVFNGIGII
jgi:hypothetical protein